MVSAGIETMLKDVSKLGTSELEYFHQQVGGLLSLRKEKTNQKRAAILMAIIKEPLLPVAMQKRFDILREKLSNETMTPAEHEKYLQLLDRTEKNGIKRLESMVELARLQNTSLDKLMLQLGIEAPFPEYV